MALSTFPTRIKTIKLLQNWLNIVAPNIFPNFILRMELPYYRAIIIPNGPRIINLSLTTTGTILYRPELCCRAALAFPMSVVVARLAGNYTSSGRWHG